QEPVLTPEDRLLYKPAEQLVPAKQLVLAAQMLDALEEKRHRFSGRAFDNGSFWENPKNSPLIRRSRSAQATLLEEMREVRRKVKEKQIVSDALARRLIVLGLMVRFLEDRGTLPASFFGRFLQGATYFFQVLRQPQALLACINILTEHFNGDVFQLTE